ncbi:MAG TPA: type III pantothenate kinase [Firmicutes bacterium]|nr:type III pantothenate kinase [Bacillota bacterium]
MLLALDVGNTHMVVGVFQEEKLLVSWRLATDPGKTEDEYGVIFLNLLETVEVSPRQIQAVVISSVVPPLLLALEKLSRKYFNREPLIVGPGVKTGMPIKYENPREVGADRIANAVAAYSLYGGPVIVVDFGTATTFCAISAEGEYLGGAIAPGIQTATEALFQRAAKLPRIELVKPPSVIGRNTVASMQAGIIYGFAGQVDAIVRRIKQEMPGVRKVVATGGLADLIARESETIDIVNHELTLQGLRLIYLRNCRG